MEGASISESQRKLLIEEALAWLRWAEGSAGDHPAYQGVGYGGIEGTPGPGGPHGIGHGGLGRGGSTGELAESESAELSDRHLVRALAFKILTILGESPLSASGEE